MDKKDVTQLSNKIIKLYEKLGKDTALGKNSYILQANRELGKLLNQVEKGLNPAERTKGSWIKVLSTQLKKKLKRGFSERMLFYAKRFYEVYGESKLNQDLNWSYYRILSGIEDAKLRKTLETETIQNNWTLEELVLRLRESGELYQGRTPRWDRPTGKLNHYKIVKTTSGQLSLDLGFYCYLSLGNKTKFKENTLVEASEKNSKTVFTKIDSEKASLYIYSGEVERVVDGDTIIIQLNLGFNLTSRQRIRLHKVWAAELGTKEGESLFHLLEKKLPKGRSVIVKSKGKDIYGRYVGDVLYSPNKGDGILSILEKGIFLNQELGSSVEEEE
ncbi:DUF1016 family protein [Leptospira semungkisensis]|uniref:DUF1016 family protein n=1 Tax=Leptospira semungkisensis TaxID=2484985 RepID=A0A4R9FPX5_9LEPT|nr:DUF1016 N-terminal domain-containing protein [Leptospira semungkisensis]TGK00816.1 DUF1016 family protein [Leptospira semungkisensis]